MPNNKLSSEVIDKARETPIVSLLDSLGINPIKINGQELVYNSPLRTEKTGSFFVNILTNRFNDFGGTEEMKGDCIRLAQSLWNTGFIETIERLISNDFTLPPSFSFSGQKSIEIDKSPFQISHVRELQHPALLQYIKQRCIPYHLANTHLKEISYKLKTKNYFAVGFANNYGGYELRNGLNFKGGKTVNSITTFERHSQSVNLFEGFFDFLSALTYYNALHPTNTTIVLNSCNNLKQALPLLSNRKQVHCYLDNDKTGQQTLQKLITNGFTVKDWSSLLYPNSKDFNDYLVASRNKR